MNCVFKFMGFTVRDCVFKLRISHLNHMGRCASDGWKFILLRWDQCGKSPLHKYTFY